MEYSGWSSRLRVPHSKRTEVHLQDPWRRDVRQPEVQVHYPGNSVYGVSESDGVGRRSCWPEETGNLRGELPVSGVCADWGDCYKC